MGPIYAIRQSVGYKAPGPNGREFSSLHQIPLPVGSLHLDNKVLKLILRNAEGEVLGTASGFIVKKELGLYLYTAWHVFTGLDPLDVKLSQKFQKRTTVEIIGAECHEDDKGTMVMSGTTSFTFDLFDAQGKPRWCQSGFDREPHVVNEIGVYLPIMIDVAWLRVSLPDPLCDIWSFAEPDDRLTGPGLYVAEDVFLCGYPHGASAIGHPEKAGAMSPVYLRRSIASSLQYKSWYHLLDGRGVAGMSGGPVVLKDGTLAGIYRGTVSTDAGQNGGSYSRKIDPDASLGLFARYRSIADVGFRKAPKPRDTSRGNIVSVSPYTCPDLEFPKRRNTMVLRADGQYYVGDEYYYFALDQDGDVLDDGWASAGPEIGPFADQASALKAIRNAQEKE